LKGKCHCGLIGFELTSDLKEVYFCNCRDCQILSGSSHHLLGVVDRGAILVNSEQLVNYKNPTDSGHEMTRHFCPKCSTPIYIESSRFKEIQMVLISTLDDPTEMEPSFEIWTKSKYVWKDNLCNLRRFESGALDN
jgi:hypothetical protein